MKKQNGITLIALIITIVVLLILAIVAINAVKDGGIITHAQNSANDYKIAQEKEQIAIGYSEYLIEKNISEDATLKVEGAQVTGSEDSGWKVTFDKTNNTYEVNKNGNIEIEKELVISEEKDIGAITYWYQTQYNPRQPEIISATGYYNDTDNDGMVDNNPSQPANIDGTYFNIKNTFFELDNFRGGNVEAKITHLDGSVENIIFTTTDNTAWEFEKTESPLEGIERLYIGFRPYAEYKSNSGAEKIDKCVTSTQYHYMCIEGEVVVPFQKLEVLGQTLEFPFTTIVTMGATEDAVQTQMYEDINNVNKVIVNFSDGSKKVFLKEQLGTELFYRNGVFDMKELLATGWEKPITSVIVEEDGAATKYNVTDSTVVEHATPGS